MNRDGKKLIKHYYRLCLTGDVREAFQFLERQTNKPAYVARFQKRVARRFFENPPYLRLKKAPHWVRTVLKSYAAYYIAVLTKTASPEDAETSLTSALIKQLGVADNLDLDELDVELERLFKTKLGWHYLGGVTAPFRGPYIYETRSLQEYNVELPQGNFLLKVWQMSDFHSLSWLDFATFGKIGTGGWAKEEGLYCVLDKYDLDSDQFKINYLKHESQHYFDYKQFPFIAKNGHQGILEYRAKLVELIYSKNPSLAMTFASQQDKNSSNPHGYAAFRLTTDLLEQIGLESPQALAGIDVKAIQEAAAILFERSTAELSNRAYWGKKVAATADL